MFSEQFTLKIKQQAHDLGFEWFGVQAVSESKTIQHYRDWLAAGHQGQMTYLQRHAQLKSHPQHLQESALSLITLGINYYVGQDHGQADHSAQHGRISRYAWGTDYHLLLQEKLQQLLDFMQAELNLTLNARILVDSSPLLEREYAERAGLGWFGKHSNLIHWQRGSWFFLAEILLDQPLAPFSEPLKGDCGNCTACLDACPTVAILDNKTLDARRCISYLTIELKEEIPLELRSKIGNWIFGCDICQEVCPWNRRAAASLEPSFQPHPGNRVPELSALMNLSATEFAERFKHSPIKRSKRRGFLRNVAVALGNSGSPLAVAALTKGLADAEPLVRQHSAWALGQIPHEEARLSLMSRLELEDEPVVMAELKDALKQ